MNRTEEEKNCPECGKPIFGRIDKKFCSDACRNAHNNRSNSDATNYVRNVNNILRKNRRVLAEMNPEGKTKSHREKLLASGFNFDFYTNTYITKDGKEYRYCYDQGYLTLDNGFVLLVERKEY